MSDSTSSPQAAEKLPSNPRFFPRDRTPLYILKAKNGQFHCMMKEPDVSKNYLWYMSEPRLVPVEELEEAMKVPNRRWFATDKPSYEMQKRVGASIDAGVPYVCLRNINDPNEYWYGKRHAEPPVEKVMLVVTVAELYLKSSLHQKRLIRLLMDAMRRVLDNPQIFRNGNTLIEVRKERPNKEQLRLLSLIPGIAKIYDGVQSAERGGDPRGPFLMDGAGGIPIIPDQRVLACISGGIDSPVAAYRMMTRGCLVNGIHFLNSTNDTASVVGKNRGIGEELSRIQGRFDMFYVDISSLQSQIVANVPNQNRTLIYKWFMLALAASFDDENRFIVTGDSAGQVASQTVPNIGTLYPTISKAVIAPLIGMPKTYIMEVARKIHTYDLSIQEGADCCQYMMCKTGANLLMGRRTLEACVRRVKLNELPVLHEVYRDGALAESSRFSYLPEVTMRSGYALSARGKAVAQRPAEGDDDDNGAAAAAAEEEEEDVVYFDAAAGTMMPERVKRAVMMAPEGNPNSLHHSGRTARMALEQVRVELASHLGVPAGNIFFTSGGTESNSIALHGYRVERDAWSHSSTRASPDTPDDAPVVKVVDLVNHETGSIAPSLTRPVGGRLHVDASQALLKLDMRAMDLSQVDSMTVSAHKINGPVGVGALYVRDPSTIHPIFTGGSQEKGVRPGTENVPAIVGFGEALRLNRSSSVHREIDAYMVEELQAMGCEVNRRGEVSGFILHATLPEGCDNTEVVTRLSVKHHVEIGTGSACKTGEVNTTVYDTLGKEAQPKRSVRISWDAFATLVDAEKVVSALEKVLRELKKK